MKSKISVFHVHICLSVYHQVFVSDVESHEPDLDEVEKVGSQFLGCAKVRLHLLYITCLWWYKRGGKERE